MKLSIGAAAIATALSAMLATTAVAAPAAAAASPTSTVSTVGADSSIQAPFFCTIYGAGSGPAGGISASCTQFSTFVALWLNCYNPYTRQYFRVASGWNGPTGVFYYWATCPPGTVPADAGFDSRPA